MAAAEKRLDARSLLTPTICDTLNPGVCLLRSTKSLIFPQSSFLSPHLVVYLLHAAVCVSTGKDEKEKKKKEIVPEY